jgi:hypothetical protein
MPSHYGLDEAWGRLTPTQVKAAGKEFVIGYLGEDIAKDLSASEIAAYHAAGVAVLFVYEYSTTAVHGGASKGTANATLACQQAIARGYPKGCAIAFAVDENTSGNPSIVDAYAKAFTAVCHANGYRSMEYGGLATVKRCADLKLTDLHWQTYAWSNNTWDTRVTIRQYQNGVTLAGQDVDLDVAVVDDYGAWMPGAEVALEETVPASGNRNAGTVLSDLWNEEMNGHSGYVATDKSPRQRLLERVDANVAAVLAAVGKPVQVTLDDATKQALVTAVTGALQTLSVGLNADALNKVEQAVHAELGKVQITVGA